MKFAVMDTETTGLFNFALPADDASQPRLAHLAMILLDENLQEERAIDLYVKPDGWVMPPEAGAINGLTTEFLAANGLPIADVLDWYVEAVDAGYVMVAFNAQYDLKQMRGELRRAGVDDRFEATQNICTMRAAMGLGVKKAGGGRGFPKLSDCCAHLGVENDGAHTAMGDARACLALFRHLHEVGGLPEAKVHYAKVAPAAKTDTPPLVPELGEPVAASLPEAF